ncbi:MAG: hypothetical protein ACU85U_15220 [Gammaproteobacteria bacterium]|jgi:hypothetical protein
MHDTQISLLDELQEAVDDLVGDSSKAQIVQCARILATYVALYKFHFGELTPTQTAGLADHIAASLEFSESLYCNGLRELLETLALLEGRDSAGDDGERAVH